MITRNASNEMVIFILRIPFVHILVMQLTFSNCYKPVAIVLAVNYRPVVIEANL